jgi:hypothetical protein
MIRARHFPANQSLAPRACTPLRNAGVGASRPVSQRTIFLAQMQAFLHFSLANSPRINTSKIFSIFRISLIPKDFNPTRINTSGAKDLKSPRINTSGYKDLKSNHSNTSKKHGRGLG